MAHRTLVVVLTLLAAAGFLISGMTSAAETSSEEDAVLAVVQTFFDSMTSGDKTAAQQILMPDGQYYGVREDPDSLVVKRRTHREYLESLGDSSDVAVERMWDPAVMIHGRIAVVWVPYDFHIDGEFRHCGVDAFSLVKTDTGWKIAGTVYTVEPNGCDPSPLGPIDSGE